MKLIPKDALIAEIERRMKLRHDSYKTHRTLSDFIAWEELEYFKEEFLPTLEVKEVDLDKYYHEFLEKEWFGNGSIRTVSEMMAFTAKHFFELGMCVNNPITATDRGTAEEIIINLKRVEQDYRIDLSKEIGWVRNKVEKGEEI